MSLVIFDEEMGHKTTHPHTHLHARARVYMHADACTHTHIQPTGTQNNTPSHTRTRARTRVHARRRMYAHAYTTHRVGGGRQQHLLHLTHACHWVLLWRRHDVIMTSEFDQRGWGGWGGSTGLVVYQRRGRGGRGEERRGEECAARTTGNEPCAQFGSVRFGSDTMMSL